MTSSSDDGHGGRAATRLETLARIARALKAQAGSEPRLPALLFMTDERRQEDLPALLAGLPRGTGVVFRHYGFADRAGLARAVARLCRERRLPLFIAGDAGLARALRADGLHLPEGLARTLGARPAWPRDRLLTVAAHGRDGLAAAARLEASAALLAPVFPTASHPGGRPLGPRRFASLARAARVPVYALGGLTPARARALGGGSAAGLATASL